AGQSRGPTASARAIGVAAPPAPAVVRRGCIGVAVIGGGVAVAVRGIAVTVRRIVRVRRVVSAVIPAGIVGACERAADDGPDGEGAKSGAPPAPAGLRRGRRGKRRDSNRCRRGNSGQGFFHGVTSV